MGCIVGKTGRINLKSLAKKRQEGKKIEKNILF
jgi:hypothetical protein